MFLDIMNTQTKAFARGSISRYLLTEMPGAQNNLLNTLTLEVDQLVIEKGPAMNGGQGFRLIRDERA
jgi:hypothetical protein